MDEDTRQASERLADQLRHIIDRLAVVRPPVADLEAAADAAGRFAEQLDGLARRARDWEISEAALLPRDFVAFSPVSGRSNPIAPPMTMRAVPDGEHGHRIEARVTFGSAYEGPPGHVHGGHLAAMFDEALGFALREPGFTAYLHVDYRAPTPLHRELVVDAAVDRVDGRKNFVRGTAKLDDRVLCEAEALFLTPRPGDSYLGYLGLEPVGESG